MPLAAGLLLCVSACIAQASVPVAGPAVVSALPAGAPAGMPMPVSPPAAMPSPPVTTEPVPEPVPEPMPEPMTGTPAPVIEAPPQPAPTPAPVPGEGAAIRARYGAPDFIRREMDTELWRYDGQRCAVFFFLRRDGNVLRLRYTETLPQGVDMAADPACVAALDQRATATPAPATGSSGVQP